MIRGNSQLCFKLAKYIGIPYRLPEESGDGIHCWELVAMIMKEVFNVEPPQVDYAGTASDASPVFFKELEAWKKVEFDERKEGDMLLFNIMGQPIHCGILISDQHMLHTMFGRESCVEDILSTTWKRRLVGVYRWQ